MYKRFALRVIDKYMNPKNEHSVYKEEQFLKKRDLNGFLKWDKLGDGVEFTPVIERVFTSNLHSLEDKLEDNEELSNEKLKEIFGAN